MRVLLNFLPLLGRGGGRQNALNLWAAIGRHGGAGHEWLAVARENLDLSPVEGAPMDVVALDVQGAGIGGGRFLAENRQLPQLAEEFGADVVFTPMGTGPLRTSMPRVAGWHDSMPVYPESPMWVGRPALDLVEDRLRTAYAAAALKGAARVCVQTSTMARRVSATFGVSPDRIRVVPNGISSFLAKEEPAPVPPREPLRVLLVTTTQPAKNLQAVPAVARELAALGVSGVELVATLDPSDGAAAMGLAAPSGSAGDVVLGGPVPVRCVGSVPHEELGDFYRSGAAVLVPSWVESFTAVYPEAWHFGLPVVTSDLDFARDLCGDGAVYAPPDQPRALARQVEAVLRDAGLRTGLKEAGRRRLARLPTWDQRLELYLAALEEAGSFA